MLSRTMTIALAAASAALTSGVAVAGTSIQLPPIEPIVNTPEPASLLLLASGVAGAAFIKRLRRRR